MLNFKFTNDLSSFDNVGPVPIAAIYGGDKHTPVINYSDNLIDFSTYSAVLDENKVGDFQFKFIGSFPLNSNILQHTENWLATGGSLDSPYYWGNSNNSYLTVTQEENASLLYSYPYWKLDLFNPSRDENIYYKQTFDAENSTPYTFSVYVSYGALDVHPEEGDYDARTSLYLRGVGGTDDLSEAGINLIWDRNNKTLKHIEDIPGTEGHLSHGFDSIMAGNKVWYRVWITSLNGADLGQLEAVIYPGGITDIPNPNYASLVPNGHIFVSHPQVTSTRQLVNYQPVLEEYQESRHAIVSEYLAGPLNRNMAAPIKTGAVVYNLLDNTKFSDYDIDDNKIYFSIKDYTEKALAYKDEQDNIKMIVAHPRFLTIINYPGSGNPYFTFPNMPFSLCTLQQNLLQRFKVELPASTSTERTWKTNVWAGPSIIDGNVVKLSGLQERSRIIWNEKPEMLTSKLIKTKHKGIMNWVSSDFETTDSSFFEARESSISVFFNYDIKILGIEPQKGLILLENNAPPDLRVSYSVDSSWKEVPEELNPIIEASSKSLTIKTDNMGNLLYSKNGDSLLHSNQSPLYSLENIADQYKSIAIISVLYDTSQLVDIRREGGKLINTDSSDYDLGSHVTYGTMGVDPTQLNVIIVKLPDSVLENIIYNFEELHPLYDPASTLTYPLDWDINREEYLTLLRYRAENGLPNIMLVELLTTVRRYTPAGVTLSITDKSTNEIYTE